MTGSKITQRQRTGTHLTNRLECQVFFSPTISICFKSTSKPPPQTRTQRANTLLHHHYTSHTHVNPARALPLHPHNTMSMTHELVLPGCLAHFKERPIRHCSGQTARAFTPQSSMSNTTYTICTHLAPKNAPRHK